MAQKKISPIEKELQRVKEDLEDLEFFIREFTNFLPLAICSVNPVGIIIDTNNAFSDLSRYKPLEIIGELLINIFLEKEEMKKVLRAVREKEFIISKELTLITKEKKKIPTNVAVSSRKDREGNFIGYFVGITDITELKTLQTEMERKVEERTKELKEKLEELEKFRKLTEGRELRMVELKEEIKKLKEELEKYKK